MDNITLRWCGKTRDHEEHLWEDAYDMHWCESSELWQTSS